MNILICRHVHINLLCLWRNKQLRIFITQELCQCIFYCNSLVCLDGSFSLVVWLRSHNIKIPLSTKKSGNHGKLNKEPSFVDQVRIPINFGSQIHWNNHFFHWISFYFFKMIPWVHFTLNLCELSEISLVDTWKKNQFIILL